MFKKILALQWSAMRLAALPLVIAAFALPLASIQGQLLLGSAPNYDRAASVLWMLQPWLPFYPALAAIIGVSIALGVWAWDQQGKHVYALTLPLSRQRYVLLKLAAGASIVAAPSVALWFGALLATANVDIPTGLHAYPTAVAFRFGLASLVVYAGVFALSAWSGRRALIVVSVFVGALLLADLGVAGASLAMDSTISFSPTVWVFETAGRIPGPFALFSGNWSMIDV